MPQHIQAPELVPLSQQQQQVDPAAALPIKRLKEKSVKWDTDILPTLPKAEWLGDRPTNTSCVSIDVGTADSWCQTMCATTTDNPLVLASTCPEKTCRCDAKDPTSLEASDALRWYRKTNDQCAACGESALLWFTLMLVGFSVLAPA